MGKKSYQPQQVSGISEPSTVPTGSLETEPISIFHFLCFIKDFPSKKQKSLGLLVVKSNLPRPPCPLGSFILILSQHHSSGRNGWETTTFCASAYLSVGSFFPAIPSKLRFFPNRLRFANIYCSLFQGVIWCFFSMICTHHQPKSLDLGWLRSLNHQLLAIHVSKFAPEAAYCVWIVHSNVKPWFPGCDLKRVTSSTRIHCKDWVLQFWCGKWSYTLQQIIGRSTRKYSQSHLPNLQVTDTLGSLVPWPNWSPNKKCWKWWVSEICG